MVDQINQLAKDADLTDRPVIEIEFDERINKSLSTRLKWRFLSDRFLEIPIDGLRSSRQHDHALRRKVAQPGRDRVPCGNGMVELNLGSSQRTPIHVRGRTNATVCERAYVAMNLSPDSANG